MTTKKDKDGNLLIRDLQGNSVKIRLPRFFKILVAYIATTKKGDILLKLRWSRPNEWSGLVLTQNFETKLRKGPNRLQIEYDVTYKGRDLIKAYLSNNGTGKYKRASIKLKTRDSFRSADFIRNTEY